MRAFLRAWLGRRCGWAITATVLMLAAIVTERLQHPLASTFFDVTSDFFGLSGVLLLALTPLVLEWAIRRVEANAGALLAQRARALGGVTLTFTWLLLLLMSPALLLGWTGIVFGAAMLFSPSGPSSDRLIGLYGFLVYAPLVAVIVLLFQQHQLKKLAMGGSRLYWSAVAIAMGVFYLRPVIIGYHLRTALTTTLDSQRERSLALLRFVGSEYDLRLLAYQRPPTYATVVALLGSDNSIERARKLYFLMTGQPFSSAPTPPVQANSLFNRNDSMRIEETGGERVGAKVTGLLLDSSVQEVRWSPTAHTAETLWTLRFANQTADTQEARATVLLPPGTVLHDAWLWIDGTQRPAAFGAKGKVRAAYKEVAVVERRDPLLVTCTDPRRVLIQCFPILPGKTMQIRLALTQVTLGDSVASPQLVDTNFAEPSSLRPTRTVTQSQSGAVVPSAVVQKVPSPRPIDLLVAVDTSALVYHTLNRETLLSALKTLPRGSRVRFVDTRLENGRESAWQPIEQLDSGFLRSLTYAGGVDAAPALQRLAATAAPAILWLHGPVPKEVASLSPLTLGPNHPWLVGLQLAPGEDGTLDPLAHDSRVVALEGTDPKEAVALIARLSQPTPPGLLPLGGREPAIGGFYFTPTADGDSPTAWARLAATSRVLRAWYTGRNETELAQAAARRRLITPLSGAVVLETAEQYRRHGLDPNNGKPAPGAPDVASAAAPEPGTFALLALGGLGLLAIGRRRASSSPGQTPGNPPRL